ncbi:hypothetical protein ONS96_012452 [Cadophora gregata f. sp. sojae]|nr:hypothetical protein ONS96_012452 [Cadophora gregata f. sp. sojae]
MTTFSTWTNTTVLYAILFLSVTVFLVASLHRLLFSPLRHIPGHPLWETSRIPFAYSLLRGHLPYAISALHERYGPIVRVSPSEISFITETAWTDIYTVFKAKGGRKLN